MGITLQKLSIQTTNEDWKESFIDRTLTKNKDKAIQKMLSLSNFGFYCNPKDSPEHMITLIERESTQLKKFTALLPDEAAIATLYTNSYILRPISILAKFKQNGNT